MIFMKRRNLAFLLTAFSVVLALVTSCNPARKWEKEEKQMIQDWVTSLGDTAYVLKPSGLYFIELSAGTGVQATDKDTVAIMYKGKFLSGRIFDTNIGDDPFPFIVGSGYVIDGLDEGILLMKNGGKAKFLTPSSLAYGGQGIYGFIPGYSPLLWEVELVSVKPAK
jgi:FKBP-type peptidyl-prolyl cis-trans isomerase